MPSHSSHQNLTVFSGAEDFIRTLKSFHLLQEGHFEYKGKAKDGTRMHGEYFINYRIMTTEQEIELAEYYQKAIQEFFPDYNNLIIVGVAMGSLFLPKVVQLSMYVDTGIEFAYTEKRDGILGLYGEQAEKCKGKHVLFLEDVCNNGTSSRELILEMEKKRKEKGITGFSLLYGVHRGHMFLTEPKGAFYAMGVIHAPSYHSLECPACEKGIPLKKYKKG
jgi:orotate phosphoribosyltransferase